MAITQKSKKITPNEINLGSRSLNRQHTNRTLVIPKFALLACGYKGQQKMTVEVKLVIEPDGSKFIKLIPQNIGNKKSC
jgi:hypothetical protein